MSAHALSGERIRSLREERGMGLRELAKQAGMAWSYLAQLERGDSTNPSLNRVAAIAAALGVEPGDLLEPADLSTEEVAR